MTRNRVRERFAATVRRDVILQARYRLYAISVFVVIVFGMLLRLLPTAARIDIGVVVPAFVMFNLVVTTFYFIGALVLLEKDEGMFAALVITPLRSAEYLLSKVVTLTALAAAETLLVVLLLFGFGFSWVPLLTGTLLLGATFALAGFVSVVGFASVDRWLLPSVLVVTALLLPLLPHFGLRAGWLYIVHPAGPPLLLLRYASGAGNAGITTLAFGVVGGMAWAAFALHVARRRFDSCIVRGGAF